MIQRCDRCGIIRGGLVERDSRNYIIPLEPWPEPELCPMCSQIKCPKCKINCEKVEFTGDYDYGFQCPNCKWREY